MCCRKPDPISTVSVKLCIGCGLVQEARWFYAAKTSTGLEARCIACCLLAGQERRERIKLRLEGKPPAPLKECHMCERTLPTISSFGRTDTQADGFDINCKECRSKSAKARRAERQRLGVQPPRVPSTDGRKCNACGEMKPCSAFRKNRGAVSGIRATCKKCDNAARLIKRHALASKSAEP